MPGRRVASHLDPQSSCACMLPYATAGRRRRRPALRTATL